MKKLILFFLFLASFYNYAQEGCQYLVNVYADDLKETGRIKLFIKNTGKETFRERKEINFCNMRVVDLESFNYDTQSFEKVRNTKKDIDCFTYRDKSKTLKSGKTHIYDIDIKSDFKILVNDSFFDSLKNKKYRFRISFALDSYKRCGNSNMMITDWIYKN